MSLVINSTVICVDVPECAENPSWVQEVKAGLIWVVCLFMEIKIEVLCFLYSGQEKKNWLQNTDPHKHN